MEKRYEVSWYKECYPLPDECGKKMFDTHEAAVIFENKLYKAGYSIWLRIMVYDPDEEDWYEYREV